MKNCDRGLENAARGRRPRAAYSRPRSQFFTIRTDPKPVNNLFLAKRGRRPRVAGFIILSLKGLRWDEISCGVYGHVYLFLYLFVYL